MHILIIPSWYKTEDNPVAGSFFEEQARGLKKRGHKTGIFFPEFSAFSSGDSFLFNEYHDDGLPTIHMRVRGLIPRCYRFNYWYLCVRAYHYIKKYIKQYGKPDVMHAHTVFFGGVVARYVSKKTGIPFVITEHYTPFITGGITHPYKIASAQKIFRETQQAIVVSSSFRKELSQKLNILPGLFEVVHNMVAPAFFEKEDQISSAAENIDNNVVFFTISFLTERKNHKLMIDAFQIFSERSEKQAIFKIGGDGPIRQELENYVDEKGLGNKVIFEGLLSRQEVKEELDKSHIFLLASTYETFGVVLIEALAAGKPIITTDSKGPRDIVTKGNGLMVHSWKPDDYAEAMMTITRHYERYDSEKISQDCFRRFSESRIMNSLEKIYNSTGNQRKANK